MRDHGAGQGDRGGAAGHGHGERHRDLVGAGRLDDAAGELAHQLERAHRAAEELEHRALGELVVAADHGGRGVDVQAGAVVAEGQAADRLRGVEQRLLDEVRLGDLRRHVGGRHGDRVDLDVVERVDETGEVGDVLLGRRAQLAVPGIDGLDALGEVGEGDAPALEDDVLVGRAAAERRPWRAPS